MLVAVFAVVASYSVVGLTPASAIPIPIPTVTGSNFEIDTDANLTVDGPTPALPALPPLDWTTGTGAAMRAGVTVKQDLAPGATDDGFTNGSKEDSDPPTVGLASAPTKADLQNFGIFLERTPTKNFVNVFFTRTADDPTGTTNLDFQFNQSAVVANGGSPQVIPAKSVGDILITYNLSNGGTVATLSRRSWLGAAWSGPTALNPTQAVGSINTSAIPVGQSGGLGALGVRTFGEMSLDLAALVPPSATSCTTFGSAFVTSRSSDSFSSSTQDFIAPEAVRISNCGSIAVHKTESFGGGTAPLSGAVFKLFTDVDPLDGPRSAIDLITSPLRTCTTDAAGDCTISNVHVGTYWLVETSTPANHVTAAEQQVAMTAGNLAVPVPTTFDDPIQTGTITVTKDAVPNDAQDFEFNLTNATLAHATTNFFLDDDADATLPNTRTFTVPVGTHTLDEINIDPAWKFDTLICTGPGVTKTGSTATIVLAVGNAVSCTYTNSYKPTTPTMTTQASATAGGASATDTATVTGDGVHPVTGTVAFYACAAAATKTACTTGGTQVGGNVAVAGGNATSVAYAPPAAAGWICFRAEFRNGGPYYANANHTNNSTECFLKQAQDLTVSQTSHVAFGRLYSWTIDKVVNNAQVAIPAGSSVTSDYDVTVGNSHVDGAWTVTGNVTVTNPNPAAFTGVTVGEAISIPGATCSVTGGGNVTVPANDFVVVPYTCTYAAQPNPLTGTATGTVGWSAATYFTPGSGATATAPVDFTGAPLTTTDQTVTVTDPAVAGGVLGTLDAATALNPTVFHYSITRSGIAGTCTTYGNRATYTATTRSGSSSASVEICVGSDLTASTTADGGKSRDDLWSITKNVDKTRVEMAAGGTATFNYEVTVTPTGSVDSGYTLSGLITVNNPNDWEAITADVTDATNVGGGATCAVTGGTAVVVPASGNVQLPYTCTFTGTPAASGTNTATVTWVAGTFHTPSGTATGNAPVSFTLGTETHKTVTVVDDKTDPANPVTLGTRNFADGPHTYSYAVTKTGVGGVCTDYTNTAKLTETGQSATKTVTVCVGQDLTVSKTALATDHRTHLWSIDKSVDQTVRSAPSGGTANYTYTVVATPTGTTVDGWSVTGQITVTNPNHWEGITATVTDLVSAGGGGNCQVGGGASVLVPALQSVQLNYSCTFVSQPTNGTNTATATWDSVQSSTPSGSATGSAAVAFVPRGVTNDTITVADDKTDPANPVTLGTASASNGPTTFTYTLGKQAPSAGCNDFTNVASIVETGQSDRQVATICGGDALTVAATADGAFDRTYLWGIDKTVDRTTITAADGASATFNYTVTVTPTGVADSAYSLGGTVTISNPNTWEDVLTDVTVTTDVGGGAVCAVTDGVARTVLRSGSLVLTYSCTFTGVPATTGTVSANAAWSAAAAATQASSAAATTPAELLLGGQTNGSVTVVDDKTDPAHPVTLGTTAFADGPKVFTYSLVKKAAGGVCTDYTNVASLTETGQSDTQAVKVCGVAIGTGGGGGVVVPPTAGGGGLAFTGDMTSALLRWALSLFGAGALLMLIGRRKATT